ncbi:MAG: hypothetical protein MUO34_06935 [Ignavibacteriaceae bacterium]|nr:hypothetical protein [Ignavibacteriaceae bacterium]
MLFAVLILEFESKQNNLNLIDSEQLDVFKKDLKYEISLITGTSEAEASIDFFQ